MSKNIGLEYIFRNFLWEKKKTIMFFNGSLNFLEK